MLVDAGMGVFGDSSFTAIREVLRVVAFGAGDFLAFTVGVRSVSVLTIGADFTIGAVRFLMVTVGADFILVVTVGTDRWLTVTVGTDDVTLTVRCGLETEVRDDLTCVLTEGALREVVLTVVLGKEVERGWDRGLVLAVVLVAEVERGLERVLLAAVLAVVDLERDERVGVFLADAERALAAGRALRVGGAFCSSCRVSVLFRCDLACPDRDFLAWAG
ncbi:MAG TPA: hypothetical protein ENH94_05610 [Phycisphaerales bacterium]|nr:hypothetical protein [Phycisphaerales bacterium]